MSRESRIALGSACALGVLAACLAGWGCSARVETAVPAADSTLVYPSREPGGVDARITLYKSVSKKSGKRLGEGQVFTMGAKARVRAAVELENREALGDRDFLIHLVWVGPGGEEVFRKQLEVSARDTSGVLETALTIPPDRREPGAYSLQVYLFRELIAEKRFTVVKGSEEPAAGAAGDEGSSEEAAAEKKKRARSGE